MSTLSGLPLEVALARLAARGITPEVRMTQAPRRPVEGGQPRVLSVSADESVLLAANFPLPLSDVAEKEGPC